MKNVRIKCRNQKCDYEGMKRYSSEEFERLQYHGGIPCLRCGFPRAVIIHSKARIRDGFKPGWQPNIRKHCATYSEYKAHLKNMGLIEMGYEDFKDEDVKEDVKVWDDELIKYMVDRGLEISDREAEALKENKLLDPNKVQTTPDEVITESEPFKKAAERHEKEVERSVANQKGLG